MIKYSYILMKYTHDPIREETVNMGLLLYAPEIKYIKFSYRENLTKLKFLFEDFKVSNLKKQCAKIEQSFSHAFYKMDKELFFESKTILDWAHSVLPHDASSLTWGDGGTGITKDIEKTFSKLIERYLSTGKGKIYDKRSDEDVWVNFSKELEKRNILSYFKPREIEIGGFKEEFEHTYKNGKIHCFKPLSLDYKREYDIKDKVFSETGKFAYINKGSADKLQLYYLLGAPRKKEFSKDFQNAKVILEEVGAKVFLEEQASELSEYIVNNIELHD